MTDKSEHKLCGICLETVEDIREHLDEEHPHHEDWVRFKVWRDCSTLCRECGEQIPFEKTFTNQAQHLVPSFCEECGTGLRSLLVDKMFR